METYYIDNRIKEVAGDTIKVKNYEEAKEYLAKYIYFVEEE